MCEHLHIGDVSMKFILASAFGGPEVLEVHDMDPLPHAEEGKVVVEVRAAGINYADIMARSGTYPPVPSAPFRPGFEVAGVIVEVGNGVTGFEVGDHVGGLSFAGGGYSSHLSMPTDLLYKLPQDFDFKVAAALLIQGLTAYFLLKESVTLPGDIVLINGAAGGVGSIATQIASAMGARVIGLASKSKHDLVKKHGAEAVFEYKDAGWSSAVLSHTDGNGVDVFLDAQGNLGDADAFDALARGARWMVYGWMGDASPGFPADKVSAFVFKNASIRGYSADWSVPQFAAAFETLVGWVKDGRLTVELTTFPLGNAAKAHEAISARQTTGKVVLVP
jgi:NADPH2:quinone reductase